MEFDTEFWRSWLIALAEVGVAIGVAWLLHSLVFIMAAKIVGRTKSQVDNGFVRHSRRPMRAIFIVFAVFPILPLLPIGDDVEKTLRQILTLILTAAVGWLAVSLTYIFNDIAVAKYPTDQVDNLRARETHTRLRLFQRILAITIIVITACLILMSIPSIRQIGVTLFASAGIAGLVAGLAARPALSNLIAGIQLALTQPIRIDDVVIVEGEWGWIEEIRATFVVVRIWDLRRLVVPLSYFIEHPFQNWTRRSADILGTVIFYADYTVPVDELREELHRILKATDLWDGKAWGLQVTDTTERTMQLRALVSAANSGAAWDLRCHVREQLIAYLQREYPNSLPRLRADSVGNAITSA